MNTFGDIVLQLSRKPLGFVLSVGLSEFIQLLFSVMLHPIFFLQYHIDSLKSFSTLSLNVCLIVFLSYCCCCFSKVR